MQEERCRKVVLPSSCRGCFCLVFVEFLGVFAVYMGYDCDSCRGGNVLVVLTIVSDIEEVFDGTASG